MAFHTYTCSTQHSPSIYSLRITGVSYGVIMSYGYDKTAQMHMCPGFSTVPDVMLISHYYIQSNLNSSNTDGSFTMANSKSFLSPFEILPITKENKYFRKFSYFIMKLYVMCTN